MHSVDRYLGHYDTWDALRSMILARGPASIPYGIFDKLFEDDLITWSARTSNVDAPVFYCLVIFVRSSGRENHSAGGNVKTFRMFQAGGTPSGQCITMSCQCTTHAPSADNNSASVGHLPLGAV